MALLAERGILRHLAVQRSVFVQSPFCWSEVVQCALGGLLIEHFVVRFCEAVLF